MPEIPAPGRGGLGAGRGRGGWSLVRQFVNQKISDEKEKGGGPARRDSGSRSSLASALLNNFRLSQRRPSQGENDLPEEGGDLHRFFATCASLTRLREELRNAINEDAESNTLLNACARPEGDTGRLLLHSIGLNASLITSGGGGTAAAQSRVNQFVLEELLPAYPSAIVEVDDKGCIPFVEPIRNWIVARRAVRKWKIDTDRTREKVALVKAKLSKKLGIAAAKGEYISDSDSEDGSSRGPSAFQYFSSGRNDQRQARMELKMIVESTDDAMFCIDEKGKILMTNHAAAKQFGYPKRELTGSNISIICNVKDSAHHGEYLERYLRTGEKRVMGKKRELQARRKDGSTFFIELGLTEVNLGGGKFIFCGFVKDATSLRAQRKSLEVAQSDAKEEGGQHSSARGIPPLVEWCFTILSEFVDHYGSGSAGRMGDGDDDDDSSRGSDLHKSFTSINGGARDRDNSLITMRDTEVVEKVASIPHLLEELLLIEDAEARSRVFDMSIVHKVLFNLDSLGNGEWLIEMLDKSIRVQKHKRLDANLVGADLDTTEGRAYQLQLIMDQEECRFLAEGAVFYLEQVSDLNIQDDMYVFHHVQMHNEITRRESGVAEMISIGDVRHFEKHRYELFDAVGGLNGLVRRICAQEDDLVKRAAATPVIRRLLDKVMFSPFATLAALFDGINHLLLMLSFRMGPASAMFHLSGRDETFQPQQYLFASATLMSSVCYFGTKTIHGNLAKYAVSENLFWKDFGTFWQLLDTVPLLLVLVCSVAVDIVLRRRAQNEDDDSDIPFFLRTMVAITTPFLWLRIMAFVKVRNKHLATFILCTVEIMKDIKWFMLVLFAAISSFAQMWTSLATESNQPESGYYMEGYLKAYTMMLGDLDSEALRIHPLMSILFVMYTFGVTVVLLNILIAIVSDSYQKAFSSSKMMLGKARVMFVSELLSLKTFHQLWKAGKTGSTRRNVNYVFVVAAMFHLWMIVGTIIEKLGHSWCIVSPNTVKLEAVLAFSFLFLLLLSMKLCLVHILNEFNDTGRLNASFRLEKKSTPRLQGAINWFVKMAYNALSSSFDSLFDREDTKNELSNSPASQEQRENRAIQRSIEKTKKQLKAEMKGQFKELQLTLRELEEQSKLDMASIQEHISTAIASAVAEAQQLTHQLLVQAIQSDNGGALSEQYSNVEDDASNESGGSLSLDQINSL